MNIVHTLEGRSKWFWGIAGSLLVIFLGIIDFLSGYELAFSLFYLIPIMAVAWYAGRRLGLVISAASAISWFIADITAGNIYSASMIYLWNTLIRLGLFTIVTALLAALRESYNTNQRQARSDFMTDAVSGRYFYELAQFELNRSRRTKRPFSLAYIDLDNFKGVNDRFGHSSGDKALRAVATCIQQRARDVDVLARLGGDEFALLLTEAGEAQARAAISRIQQGLLDEMHKNGWPVTFSIGVVTFNKMPKTVDEMVRLADSAMYSVKNARKNGIGYDVYGR